MQHPVPATELKLLEHHLLVVPEPQLAQDVQEEALLQVWALAKLASVPMTSAAAMIRIDENRDAACMWSKLFFRRSDGRLGHRRLQPRCTE